MDPGARREDDWGAGQLMRMRASWSGDWRDGAGLPARRKLCGRRGRSCRCQLLQVSEPEASSRYLPRPAPRTAGEGSWAAEGLARATRVVASVPPRTQRPGRAGSGPVHRGPGGAAWGLGVWWAAGTWLPAEPPRISFSHRLIVGPRDSSGRGGARGP